MKNSVFALALIGAVVAHPTVKREVPQEHAHQNVLDVVNKSLKLDNPDNIQDALFGLLGAKAAAEGAGNIKDADCLQQATADQAFTNAKAAGDATGMAMALVFRALERNTGSVGLASVPCASIKAVNPEIAALQQHQDPAAEGAQALNKQIATELAKQIASVGGDATLANEASTFAPGKIGDPTAAGNTCDDAADTAGCINSQKLRVDDLSAAEITAASAGAGAANASAGANLAASANVTASANATANAGANTSCNLNAGAAAGDAGKKADEAAKKAADKAAKKAAKDAAKKEKAAGGAADAASDKKGAAADAAAGDKKGAASDAAAAGDKKGAAADAAAAGDKKGAAADAAAAGDKKGAAAAAGAAAGAATGAASAAAASGAADFGSCADPTIKFGAASDGRKEDAFEATDLTNFPHGSALNSAVITQFICDQLTNKCKANAAAVTQCDAASAAAKPLKAQAAVDAFNSGLGL